MEERRPFIPSLPPLPLSWYLALGLAAPASPCASSTARAPIAHLDVVRAPGALAITRTIVGAHGGRLKAENNADRGATFQFTLPVETSSA